MPLRKKGFSKLSVAQRDYTHPGSTWVCPSLPVIDNKACVQRELQSLKEDSTFTNLPHSPSNKSTSHPWKAILWILCSSNQFLPNKVVLCSEPVPLKIFPSWDTSLKGWHWLWVSKWNTRSILHVKWGWSELMQASRLIPLCTEKFFPGVDLKQWIHPFHFLMVCIIKNITYAFCVTKNTSNNFDNNFIFHTQKESVWKLKKKTIFGAKLQISDTLGNEPLEGEN